MNHNCNHCSINNPVNTCCHPHGGRVSINGQIKLSCRYVDHHGHVSQFDLVQGEMYMIEAISQTKGKCTYACKLVDFDTVKGIEKILTAPHIVSVGALIVDYSTNYEAKLIRIGVENIISIRPMKSLDQVESDDAETYFISDPFAENKLNKSVSDMVSDPNTTTCECGCCEHS